MPPREPYEEMSITRDRVLRQWPRLKQYDWNVIDSTNRGMGDSRRIEFYGPDEGKSPAPGRPTIEVFDPRLRGEALEGPLAGDMLHYLPTVDPRWSRLRKSFEASLTPEQMNIDRRAYETHQQKYGEKRSFEKWFDMSRLDQYLGAGLQGPTPASDWTTEGYSPQQHQILGQMRQHLESTEGGAFDDLVPAGPTTGPFDDLIP